MPDEILPGVYHWTARHPDIGVRVSSYLIEPAGAVLDPMVPESGFDELPSAPRRVILTSGHHGRDAARFAQHFGIPIRASRQADEHLGGELEIEPFADGDEVAPGVKAIHLGVLCEDEGALHIALDGGMIAIADALTVHDGRPAFFRDELLGDDPEAVKRGLTGKLRDLLSYEFDSLLFAHGLPIIGHAKSALREFVTVRNGG